MSPSAPPPQPPQFARTKLLADLLGKNGDSEADILLDRFHKWKAAQTLGRECREDYYFGKDGPYFYPTLGCGLPLLHVHMLPHSKSNELPSWRQAHEAGSEKTSDATLIYVKNPHGDHLLIAAFPHSAHEIAQMKTAKHREIMQHLARIADEFVLNDLNNF
jgi:hypothetical protein